VYKPTARTLSYGHLSTINRRAGLFFLLYFGAILYLSLYPWRVVANPVQRTLEWAPLSSRRTFLDAGLNLVFYIPLGAAAFLSIRKRALGFIAALTAGVAASFTIEELQLAIPGRFGNLTDLACNSLGTLLGAVAAAALTTPPLAGRFRGFYSPRILLAGLWVVWQAFLFLPRYGPSIDAGHEIVGFLLLAVLAASSRIRGGRFMLFSWLALIWLALDELRPFRFEGPPQPFWWVPFESWFGGAPDSYYGSIFGKLFVDAGILWMERSAGIGWRWALAAPGAVLFLGELTQTYLPGRTPEITDLALLAGAAVMLYWAERLALG
jgi:VanZ family protein